MEAHQPQEESETILITVNAVVRVSVLLKSSPQKQSGLEIQWSKNAGIFINQLVHFSAGSSHIFDRQNSILFKFPLSRTFTEE